MIFRKLKYLLAKCLLWIIPDYRFYSTHLHKVSLGKNTRLYHPVRLTNVGVGDYSYVGMYSHMKNVRIGRFCSIGPNCFFGWGIHPVNGISTSPMFYSTLKQNGVSLSEIDKVTEQKDIVIGHDVFIGMNVTILDGVTIGNGAVIGAGALVSKDIPEYAIAVGNPIRVVRYRFPDDVIKRLLKLEWWNFSDAELKAVEEKFFEVEDFISKFKNRIHD